MLYPRLEVNPREGRREIPIKTRRENKAGTGADRRTGGCSAPIRQAIQKGSHRRFLVYGVTGSGKTEVYMRAAQQCVLSGKQAIMLVPEISLTTQVIERFIGRFGAEKIAVLHSRLSLGERHDEWMRIKNGEVKIVIGARSAVFAPLKKIG